jgi:hypothetical protein
LKEFTELVEEYPCVLNCWKVLHALGECSGLEEKGTPLFAECFSLVVEFAELLKDFTEVWKMYITV